MAIDLQSLSDDEIRSAALDRLTRANAFGFVGGVSLIAIEDFEVQPLEPIVFIGSSLMLLALGIIYLRWLRPMQLEAKRRGIWR